jgi:chromosomal replication initiation ATPase DnaA
LECARQLVQKGTVLYALSLQLRNRAAAGISPRQWSFDWHNADTTPVTDAVNDYLADFDNQVSAGQGLVFLAPNYGSGKTTALVQIVKHSLLNGYSGRDAKIVRFDDIVSAYKRDDADDYQYALQCARILAADEVVAPVSEGQRVLFERFCDVVDARYEAERPLFLAGNISVEELGEHYPKVHSRLHTMTAMAVEVPDIDFRIAAGRSAGTG